MFLSFMLEDLRSLILKLHTTRQRFTCEYLVN